MKQIKPKKKEGERKGESIVNFCQMASKTTRTQARTDAGSGSSIFLCDGHAIIIIVIVIVIVIATYVGQSLRAYLVTLPLEVCSLSAEVRLGTLHPVEFAPGASQSS